MFSSLVKDGECTSNACGSSSEFALLMNTLTDKICIIELLQCKSFKQSQPKEWYKVGSEVELFSHVLSPDLLSLLLLVPTSFYLTSNENKIQLILLKVRLCHKVKVYVSGSRRWIPSQRFCLILFDRDSWNLFTFTLTTQTHSAHLKFRRAVLRRIESPTRISHKVWTWSYYWNQYVL